MGTSTRQRKSSSSTTVGGSRATEPQKDWLRRGLDQPGGKLPLFDRDVQRIHPRTIQSCVERGWAEPWFDNPLKPDWLVCKLTSDGRQIVSNT